LEDELFVEEDDYVHYGEFVLVLLLRKIRKEKKKTSRILQFNLEWSFPIFFYHDCFK